MSEFAVVPLGEVATVRSGFAFKSSDWTTEGTPVVKIANVKSGRLTMDGCSFVSERTSREAKDFVLRAGDILIAMTGYIGEVAVVRSCDLPALLNQRVGRISIRDQRRLDSRFLFYLVTSSDIRQEIEGLGYGSAQPNISPSLIHGVKVPLPALPQQKAIASILGALDDKIDLNRQMNETLEAMARAIFKDWFVDFGPTRAKIEGSVPYLAPELWGLFPEKLDGFSLPEGWRVGGLSEIASLVRDAVSPSLRPAEVYDHHSLPAYDTGKNPIREIGRGILSNKTIIPADAVLLSKLNPSILRVWLVDTDPTVTAIGSTEFIVLRPARARNRTYLYCSVIEPSFRQRLAAMVTGTSNSHQRVSPGAVMNMEVVVPDDSVQKAFSETVDSLIERVIKNRRNCPAAAAQLHQS